MRKLKLVLISLIVLISLACIGLFAYWGWNNHRQTELWKDAQKNFTAANYAKATEQFQKLISLNPANEKAYVMLAEIATKQRRHYLSSYYWFRATSLNPLEHSHQDNRRKALLAAGEYQLVLDLLQSKYKKSKLNDKELLDFLEASVIAGDPEIPPKLFSELKKKQQVSPRIHLVEAFFLLRSRKIKEAKEIFEKYLDTISPEARWRANIGLARIALLQGNENDAEKHYKAAHALLPERTSWQLAAFYQRRNQLPLAIQYLEEELEYKKYNRNALVNLGELYTMLEEKNKLSALRKTVKPNGKADLEAAYYLDAMADFVSGQYLQMLNKLELSKNYMETPLHKLMKFTADIAADHYQELPHDVKELLGRNPTQEQKIRVINALLPQLAEAAQKNKREKTEIIAKILSTLLPPQSPDFLPVYETLMLTAFQKQDFFRAKEVAELLLRRNPKSELATRIMADTLLALGEPKESLHYFAKIPLKKDNVTNYASALTAVGKYADAETLLKPFLKANPQDPTFFDSYANILMLQKNYKGAAALANSLSDSPQDEYTKNYLLALIAMERKQDAESKIHYQKAIDALKKMKSTPQINYQIAYIYALTDENKKAEKVYEQLLKQNPLWPLVLVNLSEVKAALGKEYDALQLARQAKRLYPKWNAAMECLRRREAEYAKAHPPVSRKPARKNIKQNNK